MRTTGKLDTIMISPYAADTLQNSAVRGNFILSYRENQR